MRASTSSLKTFFTKTPDAASSSKYHVVASASAEERALQTAIRLSQAESQLQNCSEEELLQRALEASKEEMMKVTGVKRARSRSAELDGEGKRRKEDSDTGDVTKAEEDMILMEELMNAGEGAMKEEQEKSEQHLDFTQDSFNDKEEHVNKYEGSLDLLYCKGWIKRKERIQLQMWMLGELAWHRVSYTKPSTKQKIVTPRFTATFGKDDTGAPDSSYPVRPKSIPEPLLQLRDQLQLKTNARYNAIIINFYPTGQDYISYHADDETFLGANPTIASLSLGSGRDFYLRRKYALGSEPSNPKQHYTKGQGPAATRPTEKMKLEDGDLLVMKGRTQAEWEHSIPKRANAGPRINLTFRKVVSVKGTNNFQRYNRGLPTDDNVNTYRWDAKRQCMMPGSGGI